ncbi:MAG: glycosyl hydrolase family 18 protein [Bacilli bacterium]|nr:glycosyl hydrolase family 18 protein [Bacilli bacterium]
MKKLFYFLCTLAFIFNLGGCKDTNIHSMTVDLTELPTILTVENFELYFVKLQIMMSNESQKTVYIDETMISDEDEQKLISPGTHEITVEYEGFKAQFTIHLHEVLTIQFLDKEGKSISILSVPQGTTPIAPTAPIVEGHTFLGWSDDFENLQESKIVQALYERITVPITFYVDDSLYLSTGIFYGEDFTSIPTVPTKEGYVGVWDVEDFQNVTTPIIVHAVYHEINDALFDTIILELDNLYLDKIVEEDVTLLSDLSGFTFEWISEEPSYLSDEGALHRPYEDTMITMNVRMNYQGLIKNHEYTFLLKGYRSLEEGIASGYVYRSYNALSDEFFDTMDVIYCAFVMADVEGGFSKRASNNSSVATTNRNFLEDMSTYVIPKSHEKGIYVIPSLGGGGSVQRDTLAVIASSDILRKAFAANAVALINEYGFDGVDIDWETPTTAEKVNFTLLMMELYNAVKQNNPHHLVTAAIGGGMWQPPRYDLENSHVYLDYVNVMTYGMCSSSGNYQNALYRSTTYHDQTLRVGNTLNSCSIVETITIYNNLQVPSSKLIFGLAFYGMKQSYEDGSWVGKGTVFYTAIKNTYLASGNYASYYDENAGVPYLLSKDRLTFISYDNPRSIVEKCEYVLDNHLAGVMYWENGCDLTGDLVHAIAVGLNKE